MLVSTYARVLVIRVGVLRCDSVELLEVRTYIKMTKQELEVKGEVKGT